MLANFSFISHVFLAMHFFSTTDRDIMKTNDSTDPPLDDFHKHDARKLTVSFLTRDIVSIITQVDSSIRSYKEFSIFKTKF